MEDFEDGNFTENLTWHKLRGAEDNAGYAVEEVDGDQAFKVSEANGNSAHAWTEMNGSSFTLAANVKATHPNGVWSISAHSRINSFNDTGVLAFRLLYDTDQFKLLSGNNVVVDTAPIQEDGNWHAYRIVRDAVGSPIEVERDGQVILLAEDQSGPTAVGAVMLSGYGNSPIA